MMHERIPGIPRFEEDSWHDKRHDYALCIPVINEGKRIYHELERAQAAGVDKAVDIIICDGGSKDGSTSREILDPLGVNTLLTKRDSGKQGAQLRMGFYWALQRGYKGIVTIDGNDKDSIEDVPKFVDKLEEGYDFVQGSRFLPGGTAVRTPKIRYVAVRLIHAPVISLTAGKWYTDTTNAYRAYSRRYLIDSRVQPLRDVFQSYELLAYLSVRADQLGMKTCEIPVKRIYPPAGKTPTKISFFGGNWDLLRTLFKNLFGAYKPSKGK
jgi:glycosyltransferase involved in cell wall biosynthesis